MRRYLLFIVRLLLQPQVALIPTVELEYSVPHSVVPTLGPQRPTIDPEIDIPFFSKRQSKFLFDVPFGKRARY